MAFTPTHVFVTGEIPTAGNFNAIAADINNQCALLAGPNTYLGVQDFSGATVTLPATVDKKTVVLKVIADTDRVSTGDGQIYFSCPPALNGMNLVTVGAAVYTKSTSGTPTVQLARGRRASATSDPTYADMLTTPITIDANEFDSASAAAPAVIDTGEDDIVSTTLVDIIRVDVDTAGTGTAGLEIRLAFQTP